MSAEAPPGAPTMREILEKFDFDNTIEARRASGLLSQVVQRFPQVNLHPDTVDKATMGTIFEELIRKFNEALNENPGEHFTPRDVVHLMVDLLLAGDEERLRTKGVVLTVYDPCCGSGGMLTVAKEHVTAGETRDGKRRGKAVNPDAIRALVTRLPDKLSWTGRIRDGTISGSPRGGAQARRARPEGHSLGPDRAQ